MMNTIQKNKLVYLPSFILLPISVLGKERSIISIKNAKFGSSISSLKPYKCHERILTHTVLFTVLVIFLPLSLQLPSLELLSYSLKIMYIMHHFSLD